MVAAVAVWALLGGVATVAALNPTDAATDCPVGYVGFKIDHVDEGLDEGTYTFGAFSLEIYDVTVSDEADPEVISFSFRSAVPPVNLVFVKAGSEQNDKSRTYNYGDAGATADEDLTALDGAGISHISFCYLIVTETTAPPEETTAPPEETTAPPEETTAPPEETTAPPEETATPTGTEVVVTPTPTPSETVGGETPTPTPVVTPTPTPSETVGGATPTATPATTPPATSTETPAGNPTQSGLLLVLLLLGMGTTGLLIFSPRRFGSR